MRELKHYISTEDGEYFIDGDNNLYLKAKRKKTPLKLSLFRDHYYNLRIFNDVAVLEIDGLRMQVMKGFKTPLDYAEKIASILGIKKDDKVLDTCTGLGYTALAAARRGAKVFTVEYSDAVLELARLNPFGKALFSDPKITVLHDDIAAAIKKMKSNSFDFVIHDPPRFTHAPHLYSADFYSEIKRVMRSGGKLYHYTGSVGAKRKGRNIQKEVGKRLAAVGFKNIKSYAVLQGLTATA